MQENIPNNNEPLSNENAKPGNQLIKRESLDSSPLEVVTVEDKGSAVVLGKQRITDWFPTEEECMEFTKTWDFMLMVIGVVIEQWDKFKVEEYKKNIGEKLAD